MTDLATVLADYRTGLDTALELLTELDHVATRQQALPHPPTADDLTPLGVERERLLAALLALELQLAPLRETIARRVEQARALPGFDGMADRHHRASALVTRILALDDESLEALHQADRDRRAAAQLIDTGETTLAAYRRTLQQPAGSAAFFDRRG